MSLEIVNKKFSRLITLLIQYKITEPIRGFNLDECGFFYEKNGMGHERESCC